MPLPDGFGRFANSANRSLRFFQSGTATADFADHAYVFIAGAGANPYTPLPVVQPGSSTPVHVGSPMGTGRAAADANPTVPPAEQALPPAQVWSSGIRVANAGPAALEISFDGINVHDRLLSGESVVYVDRRECGIALRGSTAQFRVSAW